MMMTSRKLIVEGCSIYTDRLYRVETHRYLFQWVKREKDSIYSIGMMSILAAISYPIYSIRTKSIGTVISRDDNLAVIEAGKRVATFPSPISGEIVEINKTLEKKPELLNKKPYNSWIVRIKASNLEELENLKKAEEIIEKIRTFILIEDVDCSIVEE